MRGICYDSLHDYNNAIEDFSKAIELAPYYRWYVIQRGVAYFNVKDYDNAIRDFSSIEKGDHPLLTLLHLSVSYYMVNDKVKAKEYLEKAIKEISELKSDGKNGLKNFEIYLTPEEMKISEIMFDEFKPAVKTGWVAYSRSGAYHLTCINCPDENNIFIGGMDALDRTTGLLTYSTNAGTNWESLYFKNL